MNALPPFLALHPKREAASPPAPVPSVFRHAGKLVKGDVDALWWSAGNSTPDIVLLFIPGNPGFIEWYRQFLSEIHSRHRSQVAILAHANLGHSPDLPAVPESSCGLLAQVENAIEAYDAVAKHFPKSRIVLLGHSIGSWIILQVLKSRPGGPSACFLVCPALAHMALTPNGLILARFFQPRLARVFSFLSRILYLLPASVLSLMYSSWPSSQVLVLQSFLRSPSAVFACVTMAHEEMQTVGDLDVPTLALNKKIIWAYFADVDGWVGNLQRDEIVVALSSADDPDDGHRVILADGGVPHAFCINHSSLVASICSQWLIDSKFLDSTTM